MDDDTARWHWGEGIKSALEGVKLLFVLNGASALSILTFMGTTKTRALGLIAAMAVFSFGSVSSVLVMFCAYLTQLHYGKAGQKSSDATSPGAWRFHQLTYLCAGGGILFFLLGMALAAYGLICS